ncbi:hypothetical protein AMATHDRAFT_142885 [Amanita thiersii Skay4041]|uniref:Uncharacterized protein n=1 Tax=Amanita thiersii Skay4041 TaxID=703135 RepID=A0A2A9NJW8_9AGAR|nr:hypothetical protein AMATHDRAFT_142885 [Amanita thiersii Skay4041]
MNQDPQQHYINYLPVPYTHPSNPHIFPPSLNVPFSELTFGSNEDVLRALQDIDISRIANVLKTLEDAATAANVPLGVQPSTITQPPPSETARPTLPGQVPAPSNAILGLPSPNGNIVNAHRNSQPKNIQQTNPDHAYLLANKWLNPSKLSDLVEKEGLVYKKGKFSTTEEQLLKAAIENYRMAKALTAEQLLEIIFPKNEKNKDNAFWSEITAAVPQRPIIAVYHHVRRSYHPLKQQGKWSAEEDALLKQAVEDLGQQWEKVSERVGRMSSDCRDRYRNHLVNRDIRVMGSPWTKEEEEQLTQIVTRMTIQQGKDIDTDVFWGRVSEEMGGKRGRQQCRIKWTDALSKTVKNEGQKPRWSHQDAYILIHKIDSLDVNDDTEIDWKLLPDPAWNLWSAHSLQRRWLTMKRSVPNYAEMSHKELVEVLKSKKASDPFPPPPNSRRRKERKVTSAAAITDADLQRDNSLGTSGDAESGVINGENQPKGQVVMITPEDNLLSDSDD